MADHLAWRLRIIDDNGISGGNVVINSNDIRFILKGTTINVAKDTLYGSSHTNSDAGVGFTVDLCFDEIFSTNWNTGGGTNEKIVGKIFTLGDRDIDEYRIRCANFTGAEQYAPKEWYFEYSDDTTNIIDGTWFIVDYQNNITSWSQNDAKLFHIQPVISEGDLDAQELETDTIRTLIEGSIATNEDQSDTLRATNLRGHHLAWRLRILAHDGPAGSIHIGSPDIRFWQRVTEVNVAKNNDYGESYANADIGPPYTVENCFNEHLSTQWISGGGTNEKIVGKIFYSIAFDIGEYAISSPNPTQANIQGYGPKEWYLEYSDDTTNIIDGTWYAADYHDNEIGWQQGIPRTFNVNYPSVGDLLVNEQTTDHFGEVIVSEGILSVTETETDVFFAKFSPHLKIVETETDYFFSKPLVNLTPQLVVSSQYLCQFSKDNLFGLDIPMSSFLISLKKTGRNYINVTINDAAKYGQIISDYIQEGWELNLKITNKLINGNEYSNETQQFVIDSISSHKSGDKWQLVINGLSDFVDHNEVNKIDLKKVTHVQSDGNVIIFNSPLDIRVNIDDIIVFDNKDYLVKQKKITGDYVKSDMQLSTTLAL